MIQKENKNEQNLAEKKKEVIEITQEVEKQEEKKPEVKKTQNTEKSKVNLYFVHIDSDGTIIRKKVVSEINKSDAPLTNSIKALLAGPSSSSKDIISLIPQGTRLLGASVKNGIATLNFSQEFEFGAITADSYRAQLMQVVYTATEFSTVESVQFLIEGQRKEYMGSEDFQIWIGSPYKRSSFK